MASKKNNMIRDINLSAIAGALIVFVTMFGVKQCSGGDDKDDKETPFYMAKMFNKKIKNSGLINLINGGHFCYLKHHNIFVKTTKYLIDKESKQ